MICRAKSLITNKFVYGGFVQGKNAWIVQIDIEGNFRNILVDPETVGLSADMKDINGKQIFAGDIVLIESGIRHRQWQWSVVHCYKGCLNVMYGDGTDTHTNTMEYYSAIKMNKILPFVAK